MANEDHEKRERRLKLGLWLGFLGPPVAWILNLQATYSLVPWTCRHGKFFLVHLSTLVFLTLAIGAGFLARRSAREAARKIETFTNEGMEEVGPFMGQLGISTSVLFALLIVAQALPTFILSPCSE